MKVKSESEVAQSCPTLSDPMDCSPPGSSIHGIFQARVLEWGAIAFSDIYRYIYISFFRLFCYRLLQSIECRSLYLELGFFFQFIIYLFSAALGSWIALRGLSLVVGVQAYHCGGSPFPK